VVARVRVRIAAVSIFIIVAPVPVLPEPSPDTRRNKLAGRRLQSENQARLPATTGHFFTSRFVANKLHTGIIATPLSKKSPSRKKGCSPH
jgi:hypothetical protein